MTELELRFLEEYRFTESICNEMFQCDDGIQEYIYRMKQVPVEQAEQDQFWQEDYAALKHLLRVREQMRSNASHINCQGRDMMDLLDFRRRLQDQRDPLSRLATGSQSAPVEEPQEDASGDDRKAILAIILSAVTVVALICGFALLKILG